MHRQPQAVVSGALHIQTPFSVDNKKVSLTHVTFQSPLWSSRLTQMWSESHWRKLNCIGFPPSPAPFRIPPTASHLRAMYLIKHICNKVFTLQQLQESNKDGYGFPRGFLPHLRRFLLLWKHVFWWPWMPWVNPGSGAWQSFAQMPEGHIRVPGAS